MVIATLVTAPVLAQPAQTSFARLLKYNGIRKIDDKITVVKIFIEALAARVLEIDSLSETSGLILEIKSS